MRHLSEILNTSIKKWYMVESGHIRKLFSSVLLFSLLILLFTSFIFNTDNFEGYFDQLILIFMSNFCLNYFLRQILSFMSGHMHKEPRKNIAPTLLLMSYSRMLCTLRIFLLENVKIHLLCSEWRVQRNGLF